MNSFLTGYLVTRIQKGPSGKPDNHILGKTCGELAFTNALSRTGPHS
jgi:hypothetical protein